MQRAVRPLARRFVTCKSNTRTPFVRYVSLTGAIEKGIRDGKKWVEARERGQHDRFEYGGRGSERFRVAAREGNDTTSQENFRDEANATPSSSGQSLVEAPRSMPYTHASSEFIYGTSAVRAALRAHRRTLFKLYIASGEARTKDMIDKSMTKKAEAQGVEVIHVSGHEWKQLMLQMSDGRPHNGYVLEASRLPTIPALSLEKLELGNPKFTIKQQSQSKDPRNDRDTAPAIGQDTLFRCKQRSRFPLLLFLERIRDVGNIGAIMRTAYYLGVEGIIVLDHGTAQLNSVAVKASAGAAEYLPVFRVKDERSFIRDSQQNGWHFIAAISPQHSRTSIGRKSKSQNVVPALHDLTSAPTVLMLGNEGTGLAGHLEKMADSRMTILDAHQENNVVDSLNVSVAAAILMRDLLRPFLESGSA